MVEISANRSCLTGVLLLVVLVTTLLLTGFLCQKRDYIKAWDIGPYEYISTQRVSTIDRHLERGSLEHHVERASSPAFTGYHSLQSRLSISMKLVIKLQLLVLPLSVLLFRIQRQSYGLADSAGNQLYLECSSVSNFQKREPFFSF